MKFLKHKIKSLFILWALASVLIYSGCSDNEETSSETRLDSFGPTVLRGGQLNFVGENLNNVTAIVLPDNIEIPASSFKSKTAKLIVIDVPEEVVEGKVVLKTPDGDIETKTELSISEPITIASISPASARPGAEITITGTYLNLIEKVIFKDGKEVTSFVSQSKTTIKLIVPDEAQTGVIAIEDGEDVPNVVESENDFQVVLPAVTALAPNPVKPGSNLTITGTDLDLTADVNFVGGTRVLKADFVSISATQIVVKAPANVKEGKVVLRPLSLVEVETPALQLVAPAITAITPDPAKNTSNITVTGTNLDLVNKVTFGGGKDGVIQGGGTATQIVVSVPADAIDGKVKFAAASDKIDSTKSIVLVKPTITSFTPTSVNTSASPSITITGTDLDIIDSVFFGGGWKAKVSGATTTSITAPVVPGSVTGKLTLKTKNGTLVESSQTLTIVPNVPNVTGFSPAAVNLGDKLALTGTNMDVPSVVYFPSEKAGQWIIATQYGLKTTTTLEVIVPAGVASGTDVKVKFVTTKNEVYMSPAFTILPSVPVLVKTIYDESTKSPFGQGGGWGGTSQDFASTENSRGGSKSIKATFANSWGGAAQFGTWGNSPLSTAGTTHFAVSIYGGPGTNGKEIQVNIKNTSDKWIKITIKEGEWKDVQIPLSEAGSPAEITEIAFQDRGFAGVVFIDQVGLK